MTDLPPKSANDPARGRFIALQLIRLSGAVFALLGLLIIAGRVAMPQAAGYVFIVIGFIDMIVFPLLLARRWRTPRD